MKDHLELEISPDGTITTPYNDDLIELAKDMEGEITQVCRASHVEWKDDGTQKGWTVRAVHDTDLALRVGTSIEPVVSKEGDIYFFETREEALKWEIKNFWKLLPPNRHEKQENVQGGD